VGGINVSGLALRGCASRGREVMNGLSLTSGYVSSSEARHVEAPIIEPSHVPGVLRGVTSH
jgi:hypothetical protein